MLRETEEKDLKKLENLCHQAGLGFEIWSNSTRAMELKEENLTKEFYFIDNNLNEGEFLISIAARREDQVREILQTWEIITLKNFTDFMTHENMGNSIW
jgi:hypothetical protein